MRRAGMMSCLVAGLAFAALPSSGAFGAGQKGPTHAAPEAPAIEPLPVEPQEPAQPWRLLRTLQRLQAQMAQGSHPAQQAQPGLVAELTRSFAEADPSLWARRRNAAAALGLLLSGADPRAMRKRYEDGAFGDDGDMVAAGLAFAEGRAEQARILLDALDEEALGRLVAAQVALVLATLSSRDNAQRANDYFDRARLLAPGTLIEETALRRQTRLAEDRNDADRFLRLARQYARRYGRSVYAGEFHARLPAAAARLALLAEGDDLAPFEPLLALAPERARSATYLAVARAALRKGRLPLALAASRRTLETTPTMDPTARSAALYALVANATNEGPGALGRMSGWQEPAQRDERDLLRAAAAVARQVYIWPPQPPANAAPPDPPIEPSETITRAERILADGQTLLDRR